uniref:Small ribosomal subunit protein uS9c n=1 Tax=Microglena monadina TaxID=47904 RepID=A0A0S2IC85_9CHLO|nr:ribosomal protein S9 [Microglena monadina]
MSLEILARTVGRRKEAVAQVQLVKGTGQFFINNKIADEYLQKNACSIISIKAPLEILKTFDSDISSAENKSLSNGNFKNFAFDTFVKVKGGGTIGQAEAIKLGLARAICEINPLSLISILFPEQEISIDLQNKNFTIATEIRKQFKTKGYLTQDSRVKERRKYGLKKARKASQYNKR